jgi:hypothetical protein
MGLHKAFLWARSLTMAQVYLHSSLAESVVYEFMVLPVKSFEELVGRIKTKYVHPPQIAIIPKGNSTYIKPQG